MKISASSFLVRSGIVQKNDRVACEPFWRAIGWLFVGASVLGVVSFILTLTVYGFVTGKEIGFSIFFSVMIAFIFAVAPMFDFLESKRPEAMDRLRKRIVTAKAPWAWLSRLGGWVERGAEWLFDDLWIKVGRAMRRVVRAGCPIKLKIEN